MYYRDQHSPWEPRELYIEGVGDDMAIASMLYPDEFVGFEPEDFLAIRSEVIWIIAEMMGYNRPLGYDPDTGEIA